MSSISVVVGETKRKQDDYSTCLLHTAQEGSIHSVHVLQLVVHTVHTMLQKHQCCCFVGHNACAC